MTTLISLIIFNFGVWKLISAWSHISIAAIATATVATTELVGNTKLPGTLIGHWQLTQWKNSQDNLDEQIVGCVYLLNPLIKCSQQLISGFGPASAG